MSPNAESSGGRIKAMTTETTPAPSAETDGSAPRCRFCGCLKLNHSGGRGACIHCRDCDRYRVKGETRNERYRRWASIQCQREGHDWHQFGAEESVCLTCGEKKAQNAELKGGKQ